MNDSSTKFQSTENTEQTESLADVGHTAADFVPTGARRMKKHQEGLRLLGGCAWKKNVMRKFFAKNQENEQ